MARGAKRARVLAALACVDAVVIFDESSPEAALERLGFGPCYHMTRIFEHIGRTLAGHSPGRIAEALVARAGRDG